MYQETIELDMEENEVRDITSRVKEVVDSAGVGYGFCHVFPLHSTCSAFLNESDPMLHEDLEQLLEELAADDGVYHHPSNAHSHLRAMLMGCSETVPIVEGELQLGTWQSVHVASFDVRDRTRKIAVTVYPG